MTSDRPERRSFYQRRGKRAIDLAVAGVAGVLTLPLLAAVALLVSVKLGRPVLFRQERPGLRGQSFTLVKFRTMTDERDGAGELLPDADRLTGFGRLLRSTSLDELPGLWNVVKGDMSLVGPRPLLVKYLPLYTSEQSRRHDCRPGVTGWAQVNGRNSPAWSEKLAMDVWYVDHVSLRLDLTVLMRTVVTVIGRRGVSADGHATTAEFAP